VEVGEDRRTDDWNGSSDRLPVEPRVGDGAAADSKKG